MSWFGKTRTVQSWKLLPDRKYSDWPKGNMPDSNHFLPGGTRCTYKYCRLARMPSARLLRLAAHSQGSTSRHYDMNLLSASRREWAGQKVGDPRDDERNLARIGPGRHLAFDNGAFRKK